MLERMRVAVRVLHSMTHWKQRLADQLETERRWCAPDVSSWNMRCLRRGVMPLLATCLTASRKPASWGRRIAGVWGTWCP